jgi:predicted nucleic acid-binding protein
VIVVVDSSALTLLVNPDASPPIDPATGEPLTYCRERIEHLIETLGGNSKIIVPAPVLAEVLVRAGAALQAVVEQMERFPRFQIKPFDKLAAVETAIMTIDAIRAGDKKGGSAEPWQKVKIDRQIVAIARTNNAERIYSDDQGLAAFARTLEMEVVSSWDLPVPLIQGRLFDGET